jgi:poly(3-hydroxybutyrate) depolymerase
MPTGAVRRRRLVILGAVLAGAAGTPLVWRAIFTPSEPPRPAGQAQAAGTHTIRASTSTGRRGAFHLPPDHESGALPLLVLLHGTGGAGSGAILRLRALADRERFIAVAPDSVSVAGVWLTEPRAEVSTEDLRHVMACVREVLARPGVRVDRAHVLIAGFSVGGALAPHLASREDLFTAFAVLHGHVVPEGLGPRRVRGWLSTGDRDRQRPVAGVRSQADDLIRRQGFLEIETRIFPVDHTLGDEELGALVTWWLRRPDRRPARRSSHNFTGRTGFVHTSGAG